VFYSPHPSYLGDVPNTVTREEARFELGVRPDATVFLSFGAIKPYKGVEELVAAAQQLDRDRPDLDWVLIVAGLSSDEGLVRRLCEAQTLGSA
jgi:glycosyltransferase involved in cell wall biosynthesis